MADSMVRFGYIKKDEIQLAINGGFISEWSVVFTSDTKGIYLIDDNLKPIEIRSRIPVYSSIQEAVDDINTDSSTYNGQIISILQDDHYEAYTVKEKNGRFYAIPIFDRTMFDYDKIANTPVQNITSPLGQPVKISELDNGMYFIKGYFITPDNKQVHSVVGNVFVKENDHVKRITNDKIYDYSVLNGVVVVGTYLTDQMLAADGYITSSGVDIKLQALDLVTKKDLEDYINNVFRDLIVEVVNEELDTRIAEDDEITALFK